MPGGLWDLMFGNGGNGGSPDALYFSDGINGEADGLFGVLTAAVPEPSSLLLLSVPLALLPQAALIGHDFASTAGVSPARKNAPSLRQLSKRSLSNAISLGLTSG